MVEFLITEINKNYITVKTNTLLLLHLEFKV